MYCPNIRKKNGWKATLFRGMMIRQSVSGLECIDGKCNAKLNRRLKAKMKLKQLMDGRIHMDMINEEKMKSLNQKAIVTQTNKLETCKQIW